MASQLCTKCAQLQTRIEELTARCAALEAENARLLKQTARPPSGAVSRPDSARQLPGAPTESTPLGPSSAEMPSGHELCSNCDRPVPSATLSMHTMHCMRNISKCGSCSRPFPMKELQGHMASERGEPSLWRAAAATGNVAALQSAMSHGADLVAAVDTDSGDTCMHVAVRAQQLGVLKCLLGRYGPTVVTTANVAGETPLHAACSTRLPADPVQREAALAVLQSIVSLLLRSGANVDSRTVLGDTPLQVAQRTGLTELALMVSSSGQGMRPSSRELPQLSGRPGTAGASGLGSTGPGSRPGSAVRPGSARALPPLGMTRTSSSGSLS